MTLDYFISIYFISAVVVAFPVIIIRGISIFFKKTNLK